MHSKKEVIRKITTIQGVDILENTVQKIALINSKENALTEINEQYNFYEYKKNEKIFRMRFEKLVATIIQYKSSGKVLEIGPGYGLFASILSSKGYFSYEVVEPSLKLTYRIMNLVKNNKKNVNAYLKTNKNKYDIVVMLDVIEHLKNPTFVLNEIYKLLNNDGILVIQTPNYLSLMAKLCKNWSWWMIEDHKLIFSSYSIKNLVNKQYRLLFFTTYEDLSDFKKNLDGNFQNIKNKILRKSLKGCFYLLFTPLYLLIRKLIWKLGFGGLIFLIAQKSLPSSSQ